MSERVFVSRNSYHDSARLMAISRQLQALAGVHAAEVMMGTPMNCELLVRAGFASDVLATATPLDLVAAIRGEHSANLDAAEAALGTLLAGVAPVAGAASEPLAGSVAEAITLRPNANIVSIAVPGQYAAFVAGRALDAGRHVFLFSDNVPPADEVALKTRASELGLLLMGPDCGTAIIAGVGFGFANRVRRGPVGIVGASGTGIQEICCLLDGAGVGASHALGTGSRDLSAAVGGRTTAMALRALADDPGTTVIVLVAKHPDPGVAENMHKLLAGLGKPAIVRYLGEMARPSCDGVSYAGSLDEAAEWAAERQKGRSGAEVWVTRTQDREQAADPHPPRGVAAGSRLVGLFGGGSLAAEATLVLERHGIACVVPTEALRPGAPVPGNGHVIVDTGDDVYTVGRPHPMVDQAVRCGLMRSAGADPAVGVLLFDLVLGDGAHPDPAPELAAAIAQARQARGNAPLWVIASLCGADADPQGSARQREVLTAAGVHVEASAARAARFAASLMETTGMGRPVSAESMTPAKTSSDCQPDAARSLDRAAVVCDRPSHTAMINAATLTLLSGPVEVIHFGIDTVGAAPAATGARVLRGAFAPPAGGDSARVAALQLLSSGALGSAVDGANRRALDRFLASRPHLVGVGLARDVIPGMANDLFLHAGPPVSWASMCGPLRGAVIGGLLLEGLAGGADEAIQLAAGGAIRFDPCHHHDAVGPMAGLITPSMPVWILEDTEGHGKGYRIFCTLNEGLGKVLRYGAYGDEVLARLLFMAAELAPTLADALALRGPLDLRVMMAQALQMGDEGHNRNRAATSLLLRELAPAIVRATADRERAARVLEFIHRNDHFFLNLSMPMAKCMLRAAEGEHLSTMVTVMARNGTDFGIQVAGMPGRWFVGPAQQVKGLYFPGFSAADANPDIGDSAITETAGIGGFAMAAAPAIVQFVGGGPEDALATTRSMGRITLGRHSTFAIPALGFAGTPTGIDVRLVEELNLLPTINTGIAHRNAGVGQVGAGLVHPPWQCFHDALLALAAHASSDTTP